MRPTRSPSPLTGLTWLALLLALGHAALATFAMREKSTTADELAHITGGYTFNHWQDYRLHPENQVSAQDPPKLLLDRANLWLVLSGHLAARHDLDEATRRAFRRKKAQVARAVQPIDPELAEKLGTDLSALDRLTVRPRGLAHRIGARLRVELSHDPYPPVFATGPVTSGQRALIERMGYSLELAK